MWSARRSRYSNPSSFEYFWNASLACSRVTPPPRISVSLVFRVRCNSATPLISMYKSLLGIRYTPVGPKPRRLNGRINMNGEDCGGVTVARVSAVEDVGWMGKSIEEGKDLLDGKYFEEIRVIEFKMDGFFTVVDGDGLEVAARIFASFAIFWAQYWFVYVLKRSISKLILNFRNSWCSKLNGIIILLQYRGWLSELMEYY